MEFVFKLLNEAAASISAAGKVFEAQPGGVIKATEEDFEAISIMLKNKFVMPLEEWSKSKEEGAAAAAQTEEQKVEAAAVAMTQDDAFRAKVLARAATIMGDSAESTELTAAAATATTTASSKKKGS